ncbi:Immunoglobulin I-set [Trinorchestia longiramus]|nr:Immunoglobulin I-set [Trinorchestia longiramus]
MRSVWPAAPTLSKYLLAHQRWWHPSRRPIACSDLLCSHPDIHSLHLGVDQRSRGRRRDIDPSQILKASLELVSESVKPFSCYLDIFQNSEARVFDNCPPNYHRKVETPTAHIECPLDVCHLRRTSYLSQPQNLGCSLIFHLLSSVTALAVRTPTISWITKEQVVDIGSSVQLECSVQYSLDYPVLWIKRGSDETQDLPISSGPTLILREPRYSLRHDTGSSTYILQIKDLQESDGGEYLCQVLISRTNRVTASVHLLVRRPPYILDNSTRTVVVSDGDSVKLECYAGGVPIPSISWRRENNAILPTGGSIFKGNILMIPSVRKDDRGTYYCIADNGVSRGDRRNINVEVQFAPVVEATRPRVYQAMQYDMDLECHVEAYPPAAIVWIYRQEAIVNNRDYRVSQFTTADEFTDTTLRVITIEQNQFGNYTCRATNKLGQSSASVTLIGGHAPQCRSAAPARLLGGLHLDPQRPCPVELCSELVFGAEHQVSRPTGAFRSHNQLE